MSRRFSCRLIRRAFFLVLFCFLSTSIDSSWASTILNGNALSEPIILKSIAILPLENLTQEQTAAKTIKEFIKGELKGKGWVLLAKDEAVEEFLAKRRIRYTGAITRLTAREMGKVLDVDAVFVGSVTQYSVSGDRVTIGVSGRLISTLNGSIIWADDLAYAGRDFQGIFGTGVVRNIDTLAGMVVKGLVDSIADRFFLRETALSPFEIERVITFPTMAKAGERVEMKVDVLAINDEPTELRVIVRGEEISLSKIGDGKYAGFSTAPYDEGVYTIDVVATDGSNVPFIFDAIGKIVVDSSPPLIDVIADKSVFSSAKRGSVIFESRLLNLEDIDEWRAEVVDGSGKRVRGDRGFGSLPGKLIWRGETDRQGLAPDGNYTFNLIVKDAAGNETIVSKGIRVKNNPPVVNVDVDITDELVIFTFNYNPDETIQSWKITIADREGNSLKIVEGRDGTSLPGKLEYPLDDKIDVRSLKFSITAQDIAGNVFEDTKTVPSLFAKRVPFAGLKANDKLLSDF